MLLRGWGDLEVKRVTVQVLYPSGQNTTLNFLTEGVMMLGLHEECTARSDLRLSACPGTLVGPVAVHDAT